MACDPNTLLEQAKCLNACIPQGMMQATEVALLCTIANAAGGGGVTSFNARTGAVTLTLDDVSAVADSRYVLKTGDSMTGALLIDVGTKALGPGQALSLTAVYDDGPGSENFVLVKLKATFTNVLTGNYLQIIDSANVVQLQINDLAGISSNSFIAATNIGVYSNAFTFAGNIFTASSIGVGFYGMGNTTQRTSGANLTNNVTVGGVNDTIANFTDLTIYANDAAAIRNDIYQLARKLKQINDGLRVYGLFT